LTGRGEARGDACPSGHSAVPELRREAVGGDPGIEEDSALDVSGGGVCRSRRTSGFDYPETLGRRESAVRSQVVSLVRNALPSKSCTSSTFPQFRWQVVFLHHFCSSKHSLSLKARLTERRVLACDSLVLAYFDVADLRTAHPFFGPFGRAKRPFGPLFL
jgi:hypothetical protein